MINSKMGEIGTFILFGCFCLLGLLYILIFVRETKGLSDLEKKTLYAPKKTQDESEMACLNEN